MPTMYVDIMNGIAYDLPDTEPGNGFREGVYNTAQVAATGTTSRIRALLYVWQQVVLDAAPSITEGPFYNAALNNLNATQKDELRSSESSTGDLNAGTITVLSDSGYAPSYDAGGCDNPDIIDPWATLENVFTYDPGDGGGSRSFLTRYFVPTIANSSQTNTLDIWQLQSSDYELYKSNVVICSDIFHIIGPTRYQQNTQTGDLSLNTLAGRFPNNETGDAAYETYSQVKTAFKNLYGITEPGGFLIFSVPYDGDPTGEEGDPVELAPFPTGVSNNTQKCYLWNWDFGETDNEDVIQNIPRGQTTSEDVDDLVFTRSTNCPPVLRTFTRGAIKELLEKAESETRGFTGVTFHNIVGNMNEFGIYWNASISQPSGNITWTAENTPTNGTLQSKSLIITAQRCIVTSAQFGDETGLQPSGIAIDSAGNVYTANFGDDNVTKISAGGATTAQFGAIIGNNSGPTAIAIDSAGNVYTANYGDDNVYRISQDGNTTAQFGSSTGPNPSGIVIDSNGNIYTVNIGDKTVTRIQPDGTTDLQFGNNTGSQPAAIAIDSNNNVYTANIGDNTVTRIQSDGTTDQQFGGNTGSQPAAIAIDSNGYIYTANDGANTVTRISPDGNTTDLQFGGNTGSQPAAIVIDSNNNVYTANIGDNTVTRIQPDGTTDQPFGGSTGESPIAIALDSDGNVYTANRDDNTVTKITVC